MKKKKIFLNFKSRKSKVFQFNDEKRTFFLYFLLLDHSNFSKTNIFAFFWSTKFKFMDPINGYCTAPVKKELNNK